ncbi:MAG: cytochrome P460 family protein [Nitrospirota bacterium]
MGKMIKGLLMAIFLLALTAVSFAIHEIIPSETQIAMPGADAAQLNDYIIIYKPYKVWELWPGKGRLYKGREPHGSLLTTFLNDSAYYSVKNRKPFEDGAIIVKENYTSDRKFSALTVMYKIKGYNPGAGDWFWVKYAPDGKAEASGKVKGCIDCHAVNKENDYIFTGKIK